MTPAWARADSQCEYFSDKNNGYINGDVITISSIDEMKESVKNDGIQPGDLLFKEGLHHSTIITGIEDDRTIDIQGIIMTELTLELKIWVKNVWKS